MSCWRIAKALLVSNKVACQKAKQADGVTEVRFGITSASPKTSSEAESVVENILQNNEMEVKLFEATFCGFVLLTKAETT